MKRSSWVDKMMVTGLIGVVPSSSVAQQATGDRPLPEKPPIVASETIAAKPRIVLVQGHSDKDPGAVLTDPQNKQKILATERDIAGRHVEEFKKLAQAAGYDVVVMSENPALYETASVAHSEGHGPKDESLFDLAKRAELLKPDFVLYFHVNADGSNPRAQGTMVFATTHEANAPSKAFVRDANRVFSDDSALRLHNYPGIQLSTYVAPTGREPVVALVEFDFLNRQNLTSLTDPEAIAARCRKLLQSVEEVSAKDKSQASTPPKNR